MAIYHNEGAYYIWYDKKDSGKMLGGRTLSGVFKKEADAWDDAYSQFEGRHEEIVANIELYRLWREAGSPQDVTRFILGLGILSEDESVKPDVTVG